MAKIVFDERFYTKCEDLVYFNQAILFVKKYFNIETIFFYSAIKNSTYNNMQAIINGKILNIANANMINIDNIVSQSDCNTKELEIWGLSSQYASAINYLNSIYGDIIIVSIENLSLNAIKRINDIYFINHLYKEINSNLAEFISTRKHIKNILDPSTNYPLPNTELCKEYKDRQDELKKGKNLKSLQSLYFSVGEEVIKRNGYKANHHVTLLNKGVYGGIYSFNSSKVIYASVDIENGAVEIFNFRGRHQDEFTYTGISQNKQDITKKHDINV